MEMASARSAISFYNPMVLCTDCGNTGPAQCDCEIDVSKTKRKKNLFRKCDSFTGNHLTPFDGCQQYTTISTGGISLLDDILFIFR